MMHMMLISVDLSTITRSKRTDGVFPVRDRVRSYLQALGAVGAMDMSVRAHNGAPNGYAALISHGYSVEQ
eukprot:scaffold7337_cov106-Skeletonema_marinoi.AAC.8